MLNADIRHQATGRHIASVYTENAHSLYNMCLVALGPVAQISSQVEVLMSWIIHHLIIKEIRACLGSSQWEQGSFSPPISGVAQI